MKVIKKEKIETVKDLKNLMKDLPDDFPVGTFHANYWNPTLDQGQSIAILEKGLAINIDYSYNY